MKIHDDRSFDGLSCGISQDWDGLAISGRVARNIPAACGVKLAERIVARPLRSQDLNADDARTLPLQGLNANVVRDRRGMKKLALFGNVLDVELLLVKVEQIVDANLPFAPQTPSNATR